MSTLFVGNLEWAIKSETLQECFGSFPGFLKADLKRHKSSNNSKGWALIYFDSSQNAKVALKNMSDMEIQERKIYARIDMKSERKDKELNYRIFVGNLAWKITEQHLWDTFQIYNPITITLFTNMYGKSRGFALVEFSSEEELQLAIKEINSSLLMNRKIDVSIIFYGVYFKLNNTTLYTFLFCHLIV